LPAIADKEPCGSKRQPNAMRYRFAHRYLSKLTPQFTHWQVDLSRSVCPQQQQQRFLFVYICEEE
jgi:hypothetical protein